MGAIRIIKNIIMYLIALCVMLFLGYFLYNKYIVVTVATAYNSPFPTDRDRLKPGESISYKIDYCKQLSYNFRGSRYLLNIKSGVKYQLPGRVYGLQRTNAYCSEKNPEQTIVSVTIPGEIPPGEYVIIIEMTYTVNNLTEISRMYTTENFSIFL